MLAPILMGCDADPSAPVTEDGETVSSADDQSQSDRRIRLSDYKQRLSEYAMFRQPLSELRPAAGVIEYELNTPLFSDYSQKQRLIKLPPGTSANYMAHGPFDFPIGTVIAKTFYYPADLSDPSSKRDLVETRILEHRDNGWVGVSFRWNDEQTEANLAIAGGVVEVSWQHTDGQQRTNNHVIPNLNDCKRCHAGESPLPIGPKANNLNRDFAYEHGSQNQLEHWSELGVITGLPAAEEIPRLVRWDDSTENVDDRARAYLDVNCAHCHSPNGPARNSGLHLNIEETDDYHLGKFKTPVAAGKGTGGRLYGIVPGRPDESIMEYRMRTTNAGEIMPEFGKSLVHDEGLSLIRQWIADMK